MFSFLVTVAALAVIVWFGRGLWSDLTEWTPPSPDYSSWAQQTRGEGTTEQ